MDASNWLRNYMKACNPNLTYVKEDYEKKVQTFTQKYTSHPLVYANNQPIATAYDWCFLLLSLEVCNIKLRNKKSGVSKNTFQSW